MRKQTGFWTDFRRFFLRGMAAVLPTLLTVTIIVYLFNFVQGNIGKPINQGVIFIVSRIWPERTFDQWHAWWYGRIYLSYAGFIVAIIGVYFFGRFVGSLVGRAAWKLIEKTLTRTPLIKQIYPNVKQVTDFFFSDRKVQFSRVVAVEYPRKGVWSLGLLTGTGMRSIAEPTRSDLVTVFIPSSPTPVTGYTITIRRDEVIDLPLTIDEALRFTVSGGMVVPPGQMLPGRNGSAPDRKTLTRPKRMDTHQEAPS